MATDLKIDIAAEFFGKKAFKQADTAVTKLTGSVKKLAGGLGLALGARQIGIYSKNAVKAFADDQKAAKALTLTLTNLGMAFADPSVKTFISGLEAQYGIVDDLLRPAYQKLVTTTGDYLKAQDLLKTALDLSAMSGQDVVSVSDDLAKAYAGNTRGLIKYGLGLSKTEIQAMSFEEILARIAEVSKGQAEAAADSYAGALGRLQVATQNASESLGKDLITALSTLGGEGGLPKTLSLIESISSAIGDATIGISRLIRNITILASGNPIQSIRDLRKATASDKAIDRRDRATYGGIYATQYQAQAAKSSKMSPIAAASVKTQKALTKAQQDALKLAKAKAVFDLQKIQIEAALKGKISEEDAIRLKLMKAILDDNVTATEKYQKLLEAAQAKTKEMSELLTSIKTLEIKDPFGTWQVDPLTASINELTKSIGGVGTQIQASGREWSSFANTVATTVIRPNLTEWSSSFSAAASSASAATAASSTAAVTAAAKANADAIADAQAAASAALEKLKKDTADANAEAAKAAQAAIDALTKSNSEQIAAMKAASDAAIAAAAASITSGGTLATFRANEAANAGSSVSTSGNTVIVNVQGSVIAENDIATVVNDAINNSSWAGNAIGFGRTATVMQAV